MLTTQRSMQISLRWMRRILVVTLILSNFAAVMLADAAPPLQDLQLSIPIQTAFYNSAVSFGGRETGFNATPLVLLTR